MPKGIPKSGVNKGWIKKGQKLALGYTHGASSKELMRIAKLGKPGPWAGKSRPGMQGQNHHFYGGMPSYIVERIKEGQQGKILSGEQLPQWIKDRSLVKHDTDRGGPLHKQWSKSVKNRDNWKCRMSNDECSGKVVAHHILSWAKYSNLRYDINNGITLCKFHHPRTRVTEQQYAPVFSQLLANSI